MTALRITVSMVIDSVSRVFGVSTRALRSEQRDLRCAQARKAVYLLAHETGRSSVVIGRHTGDRDPTTVLHGVGAAKALVESDQSFAAEVEAARHLMQRRSHIADPDPVGAAEKVASARDPIRRAMDLSALEVALMARRLIDLEEAAAGTFELLRAIDEVAALQPSLSTADLNRFRELAPQIAAITDALSDVLETLGFQQDQKELQHDAAE